MAGWMLKMGQMVQKAAVAKEGLDLLRPKKGKEKQPPDKSKALNFMGEKPASDAVVDVDAEVVGTETVGASANVVPQTTMVPDINISPVGDGGVGSIVNQINEINANIAAISQAMQSSADIEAQYRKDLEESLQQDIADRDKLQARKRAENRRDSFGKKLLSGPKKVAGVAGNTAAKGLGLEALAGLFNINDGDEDSWYGLTEEEKEQKGKEKNFFGRKRDDMGGVERFFAGYLDAVTLDLWDHDKKGRMWGARNEEEQRVGPARWMQGFGDAITGNRFDWDGRGKNETTNEINNNTTNKNSINNVTNEKNTNLTTNINENLEPKEGHSDIAGMFDPVGTSNQSSSIDGIEDKQVKSNTKKSTESLIAGITDASAKMAPVEDQKGIIRVFDLTGKGKGKGDGGSTPGKGVSDEVPSLSPERRVSPNEIFQRSSVA